MVACADLICYLLFAIFTVFLTFCVMSWKRNHFGHASKSQKNVLFVTAHPDDECMFFGPSIVNILRMGCRVHLLCLSSGGYYKISWLRKKELRQSCAALGISLGNVTIIEHSKLPDDPNRIWTDEIVGSVILKYIMQLSVDVVISFDENGVSGHCNHIAIYYGLKYLLEQGLIPECCEVLVLETVNTVRKYSSFFDLLFCVIYMQHTQELFLSTFKEIILLWTAMKAHKSQFVWFRKLYMLFSRYVFINTLKTINFEELPSFHGDIEWLKQEVLKCRILEYRVCADICTVKTAINFC